MLRLGHLLSMLIGLCVLSIAGCGGSGGGGGTGGGGNGGGGGSGGPTTVTFNFTGSIPTTVVAAKIGDGNFTPQTLTNGVLTLSIPSGTSNYAVAFMCTIGSTYQGEEIVELSTADGLSPTFNCSGSYPGGAGTLTGTVDATAIPGAGYMYVMTQRSNAADWVDTYIGTAGANPLNFTASELSGNDMVLALVYDQKVIGDGPGLLAVKRFKNQTVPGALNGGNSVVFSASDKTVPEPITYNNVPPGYQPPSTSVDLMPGGGYAMPYTAGNTTQYPAFPAAATESGDTYRLFATSASPTNYTGVGGDVNAGLIQAAGPAAFTFPAPWTYLGPTPAALPSFNIDYRGYTGLPNVLRQVLTFWWTGVNPIRSESVIEVVATDNYQNGSTTVAIPDLSGITGFLAKPASGIQVNWEAEIWQGTQFLDGELPQSTAFSSVDNSGTYTVP